MAGGKNLASRNVRTRPWVINTNDRNAAATRREGFAATAGHNNGDPRVCTRDGDEVAEIKVVAPKRSRDTHGRPGRLGTGGHRRCRSSLPCITHVIRVYTCAGTHCPYESVCMVKRTWRARVYGLRTRGRQKNRRKPFAFRPRTRRRREDIGFPRGRATRTWPVARYPPCAGTSRTAATNRPTCTTGVP